MNTKICSRCLVEKPTSEFFTRKNAKDGLRNECKECRRLSIKSYRQTDAGKEMRRQERKRNGSGRDAKRYSENRDSILSYMSFYFKTPKGKENARRAWQTRRALKKSLPATLTNEEWNDILRSQNFKCAKCGSNDPLEQDHIVPLSRGGGYTKENIQGLCKSCNCKKSNKMEVCYAS